MAEEEVVLVSYLQYLRYLIRHKWYVFLECCRGGLVWQGIVHDWSKFLPCEWKPYALSFYGGWKYEERPQATVVAFDRAWLHHIHRNPHHWQHWLLVQDDEEDKVLSMPYQDVVEMVCDWRGAGRALGKPDTVAWYEKHREKIQLDPRSRAWTEDLLRKRC